MIRRLILEFKPDGIQLRTLYRTGTGSNPGTKARRREVERLTREGLLEALEALDRGPVECIGTAGFTTREDTLSLEPLRREGNPMASSNLPLASPNAQKTMRKGA